jgi:hypothetical protein
MIRALILIFLGFSQAGQAQHYLTGGVHGGFSVPHRPEIRNLVTGHSLGLELGAEWVPNGKREWHHRYSNPTMGLDFFAVDLGNKEQLGSQFSLIPYVRLALSEGWGTHELKMGVGVGYTTKIWDLEDNVKGLVMGSHFNAALLLQYGYRFSVSERLGLIAGLRMNHFSNGAFALPNMGTNNASIYVTARWKTPKQVPEPLPDAVLSNDFPKWKFAISTAIGVRENAPPLGPKYFVFALRAMTERRISFKSGLMASTDVFINPSIKPLLERDGMWQEKNTDLLQVGIAAGYILHFDPMEFHIMMGAYVKNAYSGQGSFYHRFGLRYDVTEHFNVQFMLKTHFAKADHPELGIGYKF